MTRADEWSAAYGTMGQLPASQLMQLPLDVLDPWMSTEGAKQPFKMYTPEKLDELAQSIREHGVIEPISCRPKSNGRMEIIAGHNRVAAARLAELRTIPAIVRPLDDAAAAIMLVDSNLKHRETLLPSEKAFAYKLRLDSMKRQGQRTDLTSAQIVQKFGGKTTREIIAGESGESHEQIRRYIRLTHLLPALLDMVDAGKPAVNAAVDLSYLSEEKQRLLLEVMQETGKVPNLAQSKAIRTAFSGGRLDKNEIMRILLPQKTALPKSIPIPAERLASFFPPDASVEQMAEVLLAAMTEYAQQHRIS